MAELNETIKKKVEGLMNEARKDSDSMKVEQRIELFQKAWELLPDTKENYSESFEILNWLTRVYVHLKNFREAKKWADLFLNCDPMRSHGEQEFMYAKVAFELGELEDAMKYFTIADKKSEGGFWKHKDTEKYFKFYKTKK